MICFGYTEGGLGATLDSEGAAGCAEHGDVFSASAVRHVATHVFLDYFAVFFIHEHQILGAGLKARGLVGFDS